MCDKQSWSANETSGTQDLLSDFHPNEHAEPLDIKC